MKPRPNVPKRLTIISYRLNSNSLLSTDSTIIETVAKLGGNMVGSGVGLAFRDLEFTDVRVGERKIREALKKAGISAEVTR